MGLVDRLVLKDLIGPVINGIVMFLAVLFGGAYLFKLTELLVKGVPLIIVLKATLYSMPSLLTQCFPMGMLLGSLLCFGRLSNDSETIAGFAGGISFWRMARPVAFLGILVSGLTVLWNELVVPPCQSAFNAITRDAAAGMMKVRQPLYYVVKKKGTDEIDEVVYIYGGIDVKTSTLYDVTITKYGDAPKNPGKPLVMLHADSAVVRDQHGYDGEFKNCYVRPLVRSKNGKLPLDSEFGSLSFSTAAEQNVRIGKDFREILQAEVVDNRSMSFTQLRDKINRERLSGNLNTLGDEVDLWGKFSVPMASLIFGLVGAPLGIRPQRGSKTVGFGIAIGIIFIYWMLYNWMYVVGKNGGLPPMVASFTPSLIGLVAACILMARTRQ